MNSITFVIPADRNIPIGGYKIVYEYANRLSSRGWQVIIGYDCRLIGSRLPVCRFLQVILGIIISKYRCLCYPKWFNISNQVEKLCIFNESDIPNTDIIIATAVSTALIVSGQPKSKKYYLIQGFEAWDGRTEDDVKDTYRLGLKNIVIASWLKNIVDEVCGDERSILIPNGIDMNEYNMYIPPEERKVKRISMLYHQGEYKGSKYGVQALVKLKKIYPELQAVLFGVPQRPNELPAWIEYVQNANTLQLRRIYNESQIYLYPAIEEGFGLTCVESMACGCALCATDYQGVHEFAIDRENAFLSPVKDVDALVQNVSLLLSEDGLRIRLAKNGYYSVQKFDWEKSVDKLEETFGCIRK